MSESSLYAVGSDDRKKVRALWRVSIRFFGLLSERFGDSRVVQVEAGSKVADLMSLLHLEANDVSLCIVNGSQVNAGAPLNDGAEVIVVPVVAGG